MLADKFLGTGEEENKVEGLLPWKIWKFMHGKVGNNEVRLINGCTYIYLQQSLKGLL